jgi:hypothetical protein
MFPTNHKLNPTIRNDGLISGEKNPPIIENAEAQHSTLLHLQ